MQAVELLRLRLANQQIGESDFSNAHDVVAHLGAVQAQDIASAAWSLGVRLPGSTAVDVEQALADKQLVWTWTMRGTLHLVAAEDAKWMVALLAPRALAKAASVYRQAGLTDDLCDRAQKLLEKALRGGHQLTRKDIMELWENAGLSTANQRGYLMLARFAQEGRICLGPLRDKQQTFVLFDEWLPNARTMERGAALAEIARRYFMGHGPATLDDFVWWTGLTRTEARTTLSQLQPQLSAIAVGGKEYLYAPGVTPRASSHAVYLLPGFDEYMLGYADRSLALRDVHRHHVYTKNAVYPGTILINGQVEGTWKRVVAPKVVQFTVMPFRSLDAAETAAVEKICASYGKFWSRSATVGFAPVN